MRDRNGRVGTATVIRNGNDAAHCAGSVLMRTAACHLSRCTASGLRQSIPEAPAPYNPSHMTCSCHHYTCPLAHACNSYFPHNLCASTQMQAAGSGGGTEQMFVGDLLLPHAVDRIGINTHRGFNPLSPELAQLVLGAQTPGLSGYRCTVPGQSKVTILGNRCDSKSSTGSHVCPALSHGVFLQPLSPF